MKKLFIDIIKCCRLDAIVFLFIYMVEIIIFHISLFRETNALKNNTNNTFSVFVFHIACIMLNNVI